MNRKPKHYIHRTVNDYFNELNMCPELNDTHEVIPRNKLESFFFKSLDKHHGHQLGDDSWDDSQDDFDGAY